MAYNPNIPQANDKLRVSQGDLLINFQGIGAGFAVNHVDLNLADAGKHTLLTMQQQVFPQLVAGSDLLVYNGQEPVTALPQLYFKRSTDAGNGIPFTAQANDGATFGWSYVPSGVQIKWGTFSFNGAVPATVTMHGPNFTSATSYNVTVSCSTATNATFSVANSTAIAFTFQSSLTAAQSYAYIAIGI